MSNAMRVEVSVGDPTGIALCPRCLHICLCTLPITGLAETGVIPLGNIAACAECDDFTDAVRKFLAGLNS
ncbi:hypothetical protein [Nocardia sp. CY41]|uniref:hypothetical protein n=1 Tax=Nocardia sp. CY41 TaxID=2608686 RepID=UPI00135C95D2|nr:hypothetical protein [Nocardia sp. CY41]